jgi:hypothetical protein
VGRGDVLLSQSAHLSGVHVLEYHDGVRERVEFLLWSMHVVVGDVSE